MAEQKSLFRLAMEGGLIGHPLHTLVIHFPIGLWGMSLLLDLIGLLDVGGDWIPAGARWCLAIGTCFAVVACLTGIVDWLGVRRDHPAQQAILIHMILNITATCLYLFNTILRFGFGDSSAAWWLTIMLSTFGYILVMYSGYLGGTIVYDYGIGVGRHRKDTHSPVATIVATHVMNMPRPAGMPEHFWPIARSNTLVEDGTLRINVNGHDMCLVRSAGHVYAVQEYCTHRYGPMSEGALHNGCLECPWHNSCFNMMTGEPVSGPAKVPLKTYPVQEIGGVICVRIPGNKPSAGPASSATGTGTRQARGSERDWERPGERTDETTGRRSSSKNKNI